jgi:hypothetical protein
VIVLMGVPIVAAGVVTLLERVITCNGKEWDA